MHLLHEISRYTMNIAISVNRVPIRLTDERWHHIIDGHVDLFNYRDDILHIMKNPKLSIVGAGAL